MLSARILVVEDFEPWRRLISSMLEKEPHLDIISEVSDGLEAVRKAKELKPDLILLDIGLPKLNGMDAARQIRCVTPNAKILFLSQETSPVVIQGALSVGASGYVVKVNAGLQLSPAIDAAISGERFVSQI